MPSCKKDRMYYIPAKDVFTNEASTHAKRVKKLSQAFYITAVERRIAFSVLIKKRTTKSKVWGLIKLK